MNQKQQSDNQNKDKNKKTNWCNRNFETNLMNKKGEKIKPEITSVEAA